MKTTALAGGAGQAYVQPTPDQAKSKSSCGASTSDQFVRAADVSAASSVKKVDNKPIQQTQTDAVEGVESRAKPSLSYRARRALWSLIVYMTYKTGKKNPIKAPTNEKFDVVPFNELEPSIDIKHIHVTKQVPKAEQSKLKNILFAAIRWLNKTFGVNVDGAPSISKDHDTNISESFGGLFKKLMDAPVVPPEIAARPNDVLGAVALAGPYAAYVEKDGDEPNAFKIDMRELAGFKVKDGLEPLGAVVRMSYDPATKQMNTTSIDYKGKTVTPGDAGWQTAQRASLASMSTHLTIVRHLVNTHMMVCGTFAGVTANTLDKDHPMRRMMHPHFHETLSTNNYKVMNLIRGDDAVFPKIFSYAPKDLHKVMDHYAESFDIRSMDPRKDAELRGMSGTGVEYPYLDNAGDLWDVIHKYTTSYVNQYYKSDEDVAKDPQLKAWFASLNEHVPNGVSGYAPTLNKESLANLCAMLIHTGAVEHENAGNITWNYATIMNHIPSLVPEGGGLPPMDVYQRALNTTVLTFLPLNLLTDDTSELALDADGAAVMKQFYADLDALQVEMDKEPFAYHKMYPKNLEVSVLT